MREWKHSLYFYRRDTMTTEAPHSTEKLFHEHLHLVEAVVYKDYNCPAFQQAHCITLDEILQHGRLGLYKACQTYNPSKNTKFTTHAINHIKWSISNECKREGLHNEKWSSDLRNDQSLDIIYTFEGQESTPLDYMEDEKADIQNNLEYKESIEEILTQIEQEISKRMADIVTLKYLEYTHMEIGERLGITHQRVSFLVKQHKDTIRDIIIAC